MIGGEECRLQGKFTICEEGFKEAHMLVGSRDITERTLELEKARDLDISYGQDVAVTYPLVMHLDSLIISEEQLYYHRQRKGNEIGFRRRI